MSRNFDKRRCSAVCKSGNPCRAWAVAGSNPALCSVHAGLNVGGGAPKGNRNALKHGLYAYALRPADTADMEQMAWKSVGHELVLARSVLRRLAEYLNQEGVTRAETLAILPAMSTMLRTAAHLAQQLEEGAFDWDEILNDLKDEWGNVIGDE